MVRQGEVTTLNLGTNIPSQEIMRTRLGAILDNEGIDLTQNEIFIHSTSNKLASKIDDTDSINFGQRGFFTAYDAETAAIFGERTVNNVGGSLDGVVLVIPKERVARMRDMGQMQVKKIDDMDGRNEVIFQRSAQDEIINYGDLLPLGSDFFKL